MTQVGSYFDLTSFWGESYFDGVFPNENKRTFLTSLSVGMIVGSLCIPPLSKLLNNRKFLLIGCSVLGAVCCFVFALWDVDLGFWGMYFLLVFWEILAAGSGGLVLAYMKELYSHQVAGSAIGLVNVFPSLGGAILQEVTAAILEGYGKTGKLYSRNAFRNALWIPFVFCNAFSLMGPLFYREFKSN